VNLGEYDDFASFIAKYLFIAGIGVNNQVIGLDEGVLDIGTSIHKWDILRVRRLIVNLIWTPIAIVLMWLFLTTPWIFFLVSLPGLVSFSVGLMLSVVVQVHSELGWSSRLPAEIPSREKIRRTRWWHLIIMIPLGILIAFVINFGMQWLHLFSPIGLWIVFILTAGFVIFILGALIVGFWPLLFTQLYWEHKEGRIIVKQGNYWVGKTV
jgi:hypothetical protein